MSCRENLSIWFTIKELYNGYPRYMSKWKWLKWRIRLTDRDFWFDSFGKFFNKWFRCFLLGHGKVRFLEDGGCNGETRYKCFHCMMSIDPQYDKVRKYMEP